MKIKMINRSIIFIVLFLGILNTSVFSQIEKDSLSVYEIDSLLKYHFHNLDSVVAKRKTDTVFYCCPYSIEVIERTSGIFSRADINFSGKWKFYLSDWRRWHEWYNRNKTHLYWNQEKRKIMLQD